MGEDYRTARIRIGDQDARMLLLALRPYADAAPDPVQRRLARILVERIESARARIQLKRVGR